MGSGVFLRVLKEKGFFELFRLVIFFFVWIRGDGEILLLGFLEFRLFGRYERISFGFLF